MAKILTTKGITFFLDELFKNSKEFVYVVTPYFKIDKQLEERLFEALDKGLKVIFIYGKDKQQINQINIDARNKIELLFYENLHAKFYMNEKHVLLTSMNMHSYSQVNNREIGVLFSKKDKNDLKVIDDCFKEFESIKTNAEPVNVLSTKIIDSPAEKFQIQSNSKSKPTISNSKYYPKIKSIIIDKLGVDEAEILPNTNFTNDLGADSLDLVELIMEFEKEFDLAIPDQQAEKIFTVTDLVKHLELEHTLIIDKPTGFCVRTGISIPFNIEKPMSFKAFKSWSKYSDVEYPEKYCHFSGEPSNGETSVGKPILKKNWKKANR